MATSRSLVVCLFLSLILGYAAGQTGSTDETTTTGTTGSITTTGDASTTAAGTTGTTGEVGTTGTTGSSSTTGVQPSKIVELRIEGTVETFNSTKFEENIANFLKIDTDRIEIIDIRSGSVIIYFRILPDPTQPDESPDEVADGFVEDVSNNKTILSGYGGYQVLDVGIVDSVPSPEPAPIPVGSSSGSDSGKIAGAIIGSILGAMILVSVGAIIYRRTKQQDQSRNLEAGIELTAPSKKAEESDEEDSSEEDDDDDDDDDDEESDEKEEPSKKQADEKKDEQPKKKEESSDDEESESESEESSSDDK